MGLPPNRLLPMAATAAVFMAVKGLVATALDNRVTDSNEARGGEEDMGDKGLLMQFLLFLLNLPTVRAKGRHCSLCILLVC